jgi:hypothetical protein
MISETLASANASEVSHGKVRNGLPDFSGKASVKQHFGNHYSTQYAQRPVRMGLTKWGRVLIQKLIVPYLITQFSGFHGTISFSCFQLLVLSQSTPSLLPSDRF